MRNQKTGRTIPLSGRKKHSYRQFLFDEEKGIGEAVVPHRTRYPPTERTDAFLLSLRVEALCPLSLGNTEDVMRVAHDHRSDIKGFIGRGGDRILRGYLF